MLTYCLKCKKDTKNVNSKVFKTENCKTMLSSKCDLCSSKKSRFTKEEEAKGLFLWKTKKVLLVVLHFKVF